MNEIKIDEFFLNRLPSYLLISLPILLITGPFLSDFALTSIGILFVINSIKNKIYYYYNNFFFKIFIVFYVVIIFSSLLSDGYILFSLEKSIAYIRFGIFSLGVFYLVDKDPNLIKKVFYSLLFCFFILSLDGFLQFYSGKNILGFTKYATRISSFFGDELVLGSYMARLFPILFGFFTIIYSEKKNNYFLFLIISTFISSEIIIFLSGERTAFFFLNLSALFIIILSPKFRILRFSMLIISAFIIILISLKFPLYKERIFDQTLTQFNININKDEKLFKQFKDKNIHIFSHKHHSHYLSAYKIFLDHKIIGIGPKNFRNVCSKEKYFINKYSCTSHPHNTYVQLLAETGLLGFIIVFFIFMTLIAYSFKHLYFQIYKKRLLFNSYQVSLMSAILITLWPFAPSGSFFNNWI
ncbi:O-antigen ligase family protein, partial [Candidatus Pelagibacter ubique]|nr:O-antigen ligase family protein [Candidatus Pelagibacter ubique]